MQTMLAIVGSDIILTCTMLFMNYLLASKNIYLLISIWKLAICTHIFNLGFNIKKFSAITLAIAFNLLSGLMIIVITSLLFIQK